MKKLILVFVAWGTFGCASHSNNNNAATEQSRNVASADIACVDQKGNRLVLAASSLRQSATPSELIVREFSSEEASLEYKDSNFSLAPGHLCSGHALDICYLSEMARELRIGRIPSGLSTGRQFKLAVDVLAKIQSGPTKWNRLQFVCSY